MKDNTDMTLCYRIHSFHTEYFLLVTPDINLVTSCVAEGVELLFETSIMSINVIIKDVVPFRDIYLSNLAASVTDTAAHLICIFTFQ